MSKDYSEWEFQPSGSLQIQTRPTPPQGEPPQVEERSSGQEVLWAVVALLLMTIVAVTAVLYPVMSGWGEQWFGAGAKDKTMLKRTITAITTETVKVKSPGRTKKETTSTATPDYPISRDREESAFPTTGENSMIITYNG